MPQVLGFARDYFRGKVVLLTGAASGIGAALTRLLLEVGSRVVATDIDREGLTHLTVDHEGKAREGVMTCELDVRDRAAWDALLATIVATYGRLDIVFNNAGVAAAGDTLTMPAEHWRHLIEVNLWGVINGSLACAPHMVQNRQGHIVNVASMYGLFPAPFEVAYATTKHAVVGFTTSLRAELAECGVAVTAICPGNVDTPIWRKSAVIGVERGHAIALLPFKTLPVEQAACEILRRVAKNPALAVFPADARFTSWLYRLWPALFIKLTRPHVRAFRALQASYTSRLGSAGEG